MYKKEIEVPDGIKYMSDWNEFWATMPKGKHFILNKGICGCGATEGFIMSGQKIILASPRKQLLYNKYSQHPQDHLHLYRFQGDEKKFFESKSCTENDIQSFNYELRQYICSGGRKILTTYDSLPKIMKILSDVGENFSDWIVVVDEFQAIFSDCQYKAETEYGFTQLLQAFPTVVYLSATPFLEKYLNELNEFSNLTMYVLKWPAAMVQVPRVEVIKSKKSAAELCSSLVEAYRNGKGKIVNLPDGQIFIAHEAVFYINNVSIICKVIRMCNLKPEEVNIICSSVSKNIKRLEELSNEMGMKFKIGVIPGKGEPHKMFTFCTSTVYIGADFYSTNAYTYIFANPKLESMTVDVSVDLQQILGRQRLEENPFRNSATLYFNTKQAKVSQVELEEAIATKNAKTFRQIENFKAAPNPADLVEALEVMIHKKGHKENYCCIYRDEKGDTQVVKNHLLEVAERRAWEVSNQIYNSDFSMYRILSSGVNVIKIADTDNEDLQKLFAEWTKDNSFSRKAYMYCELYDHYPELLEQCYFIDPIFKQYHDALGREGLEALHWRADYIRQALMPTPFDRRPKDQIAAELIKVLVVGKNYSKAEVKTILQNIYLQLGINGKPSASDVCEYLTCEESSTRENGKKIQVLKMTSPYRKRVVLYDLMTDVNHPHECEVDQVLDMIKNDSSFHLQSKVEYVRRQLNKDDRNKAKMWLPAVSWNGTFSSKSQNKLLVYSSFTALDFDNIAPDMMPAIGEWLRSFSCVYAVYITPSGLGYKAIILHDNYEPLYHYDLYNQLLKLFKCPEQDSSTIDLSRAHFLSYDPNLWINPNPCPFHFVPSTPTPITADVQTCTVVRDDKGNKMLIEDDSPVAKFLNRLNREMISDDSIIRILGKIWTGAAIQRGRNNAALSYAGVLCKAGVEKEKAQAFIESLIPNFDVEEIVNYAYSHNIFGCDRRKYRKKNS